MSHDSRPEVRNGAKSRLQGYRAVLDALTALLRRAAADHAQDRELAAGHQAVADSLAAWVNRRRVAEERSENMLGHAVVQPVRVRQSGRRNGRVVELRAAPTYSRIRVIEWGSIDEVHEDVAFTVDDVVTLWTRCVRAGNIFAPVELRGVLGATPELLWLPEDARVEIVQGPRFAGQPAAIVRDLKPMRPPEGSKGSVITSEGFHPLVWDCDPVYSPVLGWSDPETSVEVLLCALNVAPDDGLLRPQLLAALRARYAKVVNAEGVYPPERYPWRDTLEPSASMLKYLQG
jgi:hypothetical protein